jgi:lipoprotein-anchoring transpeptidase ErfK/SrfK
VLAVAAAGASHTRLPASARVSVIGAGDVEWPRVAVRVRPSRAARAIRTFGRFRSDYRPRVVLALGAVRDASGTPTWYRVSLPGRPNGHTGWIPAGSVSLHPVDRWLVILRGARRFEFVERGRVVRSGPVAIGAPRMPTPLGLFYVQDGFRPTKDPILGAYAFETSAYSRLSEWPGGGVVGVHGTNTPALIGQAVSHGCVRLRNADIDYLRTRVPPGTPVKIVR